MSIDHQLKTDLIELAGALVTGKLLPAIDTDHWYASTPLAERRGIIAALELAHDRHRLLAICIKKWVDKL